MNVLMILNDPPYGTERTYNGVRLALNLLVKDGGLDLTVCFYADPRPDVRMHRPGRLWHAGKVLLEKDILWRWL